MLFGQGSDEKLISIFFVHVVKEMVEIVLQLS